MSLCRAANISYHQNRNKDPGGVTSSPRIKLAVAWGRQASAGTPYEESITTGLKRHEILTPQADSPALLAPLAKKSI